MKSKLLLYLPVIHQGYLKIIKKYPDSEIYVIDESLIKLIDQEFDYLRKEIRAITPKQALVSLQALFPNRKIELISAKEFMALEKFEGKTILPKEDIFVWLAEKYLKNNKDGEKKPTNISILVEFDETFLRWDRNNSTEKRTIEGVSKVSKKIIDKQMMALATKESGLCSDWWRQVGAVVIRDDSKGKNKNVIAMTHNQHLPTPYAPYISGDPRNAFHKGKNIDLSTSIHAEAAMISQAAKEGQSLDGAEMYVTTFPCPACAKLVANSGIKKLYFAEGYAMIDGESVLKNAGVEIIRVE